jgi:hypothetical protein
MACPDGGAPGSPAAQRLDPMSLHSGGKAPTYHHPARNEPTLLMATPSCSVKVVPLRGTGSHGSSEALLRADGVSIRRQRASCDLRQLWLVYYFFMKVQQVLPSLAISFVALACSLPANALTFSWSFTDNYIPGSPTFGLETSGTITGLSEGVNNFKLPGITLAVTSSETSLGLSTFSSSPAQDGTVTVTNGLITDYDFNLVADERSGAFLAGLGGVLYTVAPGDTTFYTGNANIFSPVSPAPVPGPLPVLGASAAFAWTRRIRKRISLAARSSDFSQG